MFQIYRQDETLAGASFNDQNQPTRVVAPDYCRHYCLLLVLPLIAPRLLPTSPTATHPLLLLAAAAVGAWACSHPDC